MNFSKTDIPKILYSAIPKRFQDFSPSDFEDFVAQLFRDIGYKVEQTNYSGDFGADLLLESESERFVVQIKRYSEHNKVGVKDVNQVIGSKDYYEANKAIIITTSSFSPQATRLCHKAQVEMWGWEKLLKQICDTYFRGLDYFTFFKDQLSDHNIKSRKIKVGSKANANTLDSIFNFRISELKTGLSTAERYSEKVSLLIVEVTNKSDENIFLNVFVPDFVTADHRQIKANSLCSSYFTGGIIYAGTTIKLGFFFYADQLTGLNVNSKLVLKLSLDNEQVLWHFIEIQSLDGIILPPTIPSASGGMCFIATALYGKDSFEYRELTIFRDHILCKYSLGRFMISLYYKAGPRLVTLITYYSPVKRSAAMIVKNLARIAHISNRIFQDTIPM